MCSNWTNYGISPEKEPKTLGLDCIVPSHSPYCRIRHWRSQRRYLPQAWTQIPVPYKLCATFSDFWEAYQNVFPQETHLSVGKETGLTAHVERWNLTLRQSLARFVRKTLSFSKSDTYHLAVLSLFIHRYNLVMKHAISQF